MGSREQGEPGNFPRGQTSQDHSSLEDSAAQRCIQECSGAPVNRKVVVD